MPNWCSNTLEVRGEPKELKKFQKVMTVEDGTFNWTDWFPTPAGLTGTKSPATVKDELTPQEIEGGCLTTEQSEALIKEQGHNNWYDWCIANWGVKWSACDASDWHEADDDGKALYASFESPWCPPELVIEKMIVEFPKLGFALDYREEGMGFCGELVGYGGEIVHAESRDTFADSSSILEQAMEH